MAYRGIGRREQEARREAALAHFLKHPDATGDEVQALLVKGKLTGRPGPQLGTGTIYEIRKRALGMLGAVGPATQARASEDGEALAELREQARRLQAVLARIPGVAEVHITREGARVVRLQPSEEPL